MSLIIIRHLSTRIFARELKNQLLKKPEARILRVQKRGTGDHSKMWVVERSVAISLLPMAPLTFLMPNMICDNILTLLVCCHSQWGVGGIVKDYIRPKIFGNIFPKVVLTTVYILNITAFFALIKFNYEDVGIGRAIRKFWALEPSTK